MGTCPSKPGEAAAPAAPKVNAGSIIKKINTTGGPKVNPGPKANNRNNQPPKANNSQLTEEQKLEKEINDIDNKIIGLEMSQDYSHGGELRFITVPELKRKKEKLQRKLEELKNPKVIVESPEPSAPELPNSSEDPSQAGGKRRRRTMKRKSRRQPKRKH